MLSNDIRTRNLRNNVRAQTPSVFFYILTDSKAYSNWPGIGVHTYDSVVTETEVFLATYPCFVVGPRHIDKKNL